MSDFKGHHFDGKVVLWTLWWYRQYPVSNRGLESMVTDRGMAVDHSTSVRRVRRFVPEMEIRVSL